jgi:hypothetical protein
MGTGFSGTWIATITVGIVTAALIGCSGSNGTRPAAPETSHPAALATTAGITCDDISDGMGQQWPGRCEHLPQRRQSLLAPGWEQEHSNATNDINAMALDYGQPTAPVNLPSSGTAPTG